MHILMVALLINDLSYRQKFRIVFFLRKKKEEKKCLLARSSACAWVRVHKSNCQLPKIPVSFYLLCNRVFFTQKKKTKKKKIERKRRWSTALLNDKWIIISIFSLFCLCCVIDSKMSHVPFRTRLRRKSCDNVILRRVFHFVSRFLFFHFSFFFFVEKQIFFFVSL